MRTCIWEGGRSPSVLSRPQFRQRPCEASTDSDRTAGFCLLLLFRPCDFREKEKGIVEGEKRKFVSSFSSPESCLLLPLLLLLIVAATPFPPTRLFRFCLEHLERERESQKQQRKRKNGKKCTQERWRKKRKRKKTVIRSPCSVRMQRVSFLHARM